MNNNVTIASFIGANLAAAFGVGNDRVSASYDSGGGKVSIMLNMSNDNTYVTYLLEYDKGSRNVSVSCDACEYLSLPSGRFNGVQSKVVGIDLAAMLEIRNVIETSLREVEEAQHEQN